ncbi:anaerobic nitric oxide reductase flavorubredoxin [Fusibacter bizertensis]|uniref:Anaerobic nitric oxide reductase flavorubredoxin n=1 Tax=Fusibacter bizertensis TaxID=1488331 RepID=A0ABT6NGA5_9FIRM|nr:anaerobic nitric oxide reductase flavorubredoxin [Fusibacter bizertensis]MDH8679407.1 anaerobic nitric oxide reductase flavorubredoxin [Fusibacter bizertensis]
MFKINERITWVGKIDWDLKKFHGEEYSTHRGSSYNSYLIQDEKVALIDTVWQPFDEEFVKRLKEVIDLKKIDYIIANHAEIDHSGGLPELLKEIPNVPIYCTANGVKSLKGHYHQDWNFHVVKTGDTLDLGEGKLVFIEAPMLHWPDSMFEYYTKDAVLFSNDAFGQHYASELMYNDLVDQAELKQEAIKYYANILTPFSALVGKKIEEVLGFKLPVNMICPSHGVIWRDNPVQIVEQYVDWANNYQEHQVTLLYDTMWDATKHMAEAIAEGIKSVDPTLNIKLFNVSKIDKNDVITEVFKAKLVVAGSSTINKGILSGMASILEIMKGLKFKHKKAAGFGSYGWSGESPKLMTEALKQCGLEVVAEGLGVLWRPDEEGRQACFDYGVTLAKKL